jgi:phage shock protein A
MLNSCDHSDLIHPAIVIQEGNKCPLCDALNEIKNLESQLDDEKNYTKELERDVDRFAREITALEERIALLTPLED